MAAVTRWRGQAARQQCSGSGAARAGVRARVAQREQRSQGREGEREKERKVRELSLKFLKIFNGNFKNFEYESCSKCRNLQLLFQAFPHLRFRLKVTNSNLNAKENHPIHIVFRIFLQIWCANLKIFEHESCLLYETLQLWFWAKV